MENIRINVGELLKDCPSGMELDCTLFDNVTFISVVECDKQINGIRIKTGDNFYHLTKFGTCISDKNAKCVIFPKGKNSWEGFQRPFKDGDIVATDKGHWIGITEGGKKDSFIPTYCVLKSNGQFEAYFDEKRKWCFYRLATEEEKAKLFQVIKDNGYKWNSETKTLEKLIESKFKSGDILVNKYGKPFILKEYLPKMNIVSSYCGLNMCDVFNESSCNWAFANSVRFATEEEKAKLFQAIKDNGYKWNEETKTLVKLIEPNFKDGDVVVTNLGSIGIISKKLNNGFYETHCLLRGCDMTRNVCAYVERLATEEEKAKLFQAIKDNGYKWNSETKTLEKLFKPKFKVWDKIRLKNNRHITAVIVDITENQYVLSSCDQRYLDFKYQDKFELVPNKFDFSTLIPFESKVLVRKINTDYWLPDVYVGRNKFDNFVVLYNKENPFYRQCIPYEGNEHLLGTTNNCDKFYKVWLNI